MNYIRLKGRTQSWDDSRSIGWHLSHTNGIKTLHSQEISTLRVVGAVLPASWGIYTGTGATKSDYTPLIFFFPTSFLAVANLCHSFLPASSTHSHCLPSVPYKQPWSLPRCLADPRTQPGCKLLMKLTPNTEREKYNHPHGAARPCGCNV